MKHFLMIVAVSLMQATAQAATNIPVEAPAKLFQPILVELKAKTQVPILLPSAFPAPIKEGDIHDIEIDANSSKYSVVMYYEKGYGNAGYFGNIDGELNGKPHFKGRKVSLVNGVTGYFWGKSCGGSCPPSHFAWFQGNNLYTLQLSLPVRTKAEEEQLMISVANSAISGGAR